MKRTFLWVVLSSSLVLQGCPDDEPDPVPAPEDTSGDTDMTDGDDASDTTDGDDATDGSDATDSDVTDPPALRCFVGIESGFEALADATFTADDERAAYRQSPGFQVDFRAETDAVPSGTSVELTLAGATVQSLGVDSAGEVSFTNITLPPGASLAAMEVTVDGQTLDCGGTLTVETGSCDVELAPAGGTCLVGDNNETPATEQTFTVTNPNGLCDRAVLIYRLGGNELTSDAVPLTDGTAEVTVQLFAGPVNGEAVDVKAQVRSTGSATLTAETDFVTFPVDSDAPTPTITSVLNDAQLGLANDLNGDLSDGLQIQVQGQASGLDGGTVTVTTASGQSVEATLNDQTWTAELDFPASINDDEIVVTAVDGCGNQATAQVTGIDVSVTASALTIVSPVSGTLLAVTDEDASTPTLYETDFVVVATELSFPAVLEVRCSPDLDQVAPILVGAAQVDSASGDDTYTITDVTIDTTGAQNTWECKVIDSGINPTESAVVALVIGLPAPTITITGPTDAVTNQSSLALSGTAANLDGQAGTLTLIDAADQVVYVDVPTAATVLGGGFNFTTWFTSDGTAAGTAVADGEYTVQLGMVDTFGNNACLGAGADCSLSIRLDTTAPAISLQAPAAGNVDPATLPDSSAAAGYQTTVTIAVDDAGFEAGTEVCLTQGGAVTCAMVADGATTVDFADVTLQPGANELSFVGTDVAGNVSGALVETLTLLSDAPVVTFVSPSSSTSTATPQITLVVSVTTIEGTALAGADVVARIDGVASADVPSFDAAAGTYTFTDLALPGFGIFSVQVEASVGGGTLGATTAIDINVKDGQPEIAFSGLGTSPATLNLASAQCAPGQTDCVLTVTCSTLNLDTGSVASLSWQCSGGALQQEVTTVAADAAVFTGISLANNSTCTLSCDATDLGTQQSATSDPFQVKVDRTAPALGPYLKPENNSLIFVDDESPALGFQYSPQIRVQGVEAGQVVEMNITSEQGSVTLQKAVPSPVADDELATLFFDQSTLPQGTATFTATVTDAAGNAAVAAVKTVSVQSEAPLVRLSQPVYLAATACTTDADCGTGLCVPGVTGNVCAIAWGISSDRSVLVKTQNIPGLTLNQVRICSDNPAYMGNAECGESGAGYHEVKTVPLDGEGVVDLANLAEGSHMLVAEAKLNDTGTLWATSLTASTEDDRTRSVSVDITPPAIGPFGVPTNATPLDCLSAAEGDAGQFDLSVTCTETGTATVTANGLQVASGAVTESVGQLFEDVALSDAAAVEMSVTCTDRYGNVSSPTVSTFEVDTVPPTIAITAPVGSPVLAGDSLDVSVSSNAVGQDVTLTSSLSGEFGPVAVGANEGALFDNATYSVLTDGTHVLTASVSDACGNPAQTTSGAIVVDTTPPGVAIDSPAPGALLTDENDASVDGGYQVALGVSTTGDATTWEVRLAPNCAADFSGCEPAQVLATGAVTNPGGAEPTQNVTLPVFKTPDYLVLTVAVMDAAGNESTASNNLTVTLASCSLSFAGLPAGAVGNALCATPNADCASVDLDFTVQLVGACSGLTTVDLYEGGALAASAPVVGATASFTRTYAHDTDSTLEGRAGSGLSEVSTGVRSLEVDLVSPTVAFVAKDVAGFTTPANGATVSYSMGDDQGGAAGLQINLSVDVTDDGLGGGSITALTASGAGLSSAPALPVDVVGASFSVDFTNVTLPEATDAPVMVTATDSAGNTATGMFTYSADTTAPDEPTVAIDSFNRRRPSVTLSWDSAADATEVDVRYSLAPISEFTFDAACAATAIPGAAALPTPSGGTDTYTVTGPDTRPPTDPCYFVMRSDSVPYYFAVRVRDAAGNWSPVGTSSVVSSTDLRLRFAQVSVDDSAFNATHDDDYDKRISPIGDINNDGFADFALGGNTSYGNCIFYGSDTETIPTLTAAPDFTATLSGTGWQCLFDSDGFGTPVELRAGHIAQNIGDVNGDGLQDLGVPFGKNTITPTRSVRVYFGVSGGQISPVPDVIIGGHAPLESTTTTRFAGGGDFNNDGIDDLILGSRRNGNGEAYVVPGSASWTTGLSIDLSDPTDLATWTVQIFQMPIAVTTPRFGAQVGFVGDVLGNDGYDDIVVTAENPTENTQAVVFRGRDTAATATFAVSYAHDGTQGEDATSVQLLPEPGAKNNFGASNNIFNEDVTGDGVDDVIIAHPKSDSNDLRIYVFDGVAIGNADGGTLTIAPDYNNEIGDGLFTSAAGAGFVLNGPFINIGSLGNIFDSSASTAGAIGYSRTDDAGATKLYIRFNLNRGVDEPLGSFSRVDMSFADPFDAANQSFVNRDVLGIGDFNGDGLEDFVISTTTGYAVIAY